MSFLRKLGKRGLTNAAMRGIIYLAFAGVAHLVERDLAKVEVASSSLVARSKKKNHPKGGFSFWNAAGRVELAASTSAQRVKSRGKGRAPANGSAIRGMPGSEFEPRLFCCAKSVACGRVIEREWGNPQRFPPHTPPSLRYARVRTTKPEGNHKKKNHPLGGFSFWNAAGRVELAASTCAQRGEPLRRGRRPRRPVSAAVPRWERIPTSLPSLRAAKQVPLGYSSE